VANPAKAQALLQWKATRSLPEIVATAWNWMEHHRTSAIAR
jgi:UDP-glucose 4-epimerase